MTAASAESGSFRDRRGRIFYVDGRVLRTVMPAAIEDYEYVRSTGFVDGLIANGQLVGETVVDRSVLGPDGDAASLVLEHPRLAYISYPYEWSFSALKAAALLHLDIQLAALERDITLTDASAYNVQFIGPRPVFIDHLSFRRYEPGEFWAGHRQFCEQFVNPLLLRAVLGVPHNAWMRGSLEGITADELSKLLPWRSRLSWNILTNVFMQAKLQRSASASTAARNVESKRLPKIGFEQMLRSLRNWIARLVPKDDARSVWQDYASDNSYSDTEAGLKRRFIGSFVSAVSPGIVLDLGCNTGDYSKLALDNGADLAVGFDFDHGALEKAYARARDESLDFLPLFLDAANPSPDQGWQQSERPGLSARARGDAVFALALVHHMAIARNLPLEQVINWITAMAPAGVIEFVPKGDAMVQRLLRLREDLFDDYEQPVFEKLLQEQARLVRSEKVSDSGRMLYWFERP